MSHVDDTKGIALYTTDIDDQNPLNYTYDAIGNLTSDVYQTNSDFEIFDGFFFLASSLKFLAIGKAMAKNFALMQEKII